MRSNIVESTVRRLLPLFVCGLVVCPAALHAQSGPVSFVEEVPRFVGYSNNAAVGDTGHRAIETWCTGHWCCSLIGRGELGPKPYIPFAARVLPVINERIVAITAVDIRTGAKLCLTIPAERDLRLVDFRVMNENSICLLADAPSAEGTTESLFLAASFLDRKVTLQRVSRTPERDRLFALGLRVYGPKQDPAPNALIAAIPEPDADGVLSILGDGWDAHGWIDVTDPVDNQRLVAPGSTAARLILVDTPGEGRLSMTEKDYMGAGHTRWRMSDRAVRADDATAQSIRFPRLMIPPVSRLALAATSINTETSVTATSLYSVTAGRPRRVWTVPAGHTITHLEVSENEESIAVTLTNDDTKANDAETFVSLQTATGETIISHHPSPDDEPLSLAGVTNEGELIYFTGSGSSRILVHRLQEEAPRQLVELTLPPE